MSQPPAQATGPGTTLRFPAGARSLFARTARCVTSAVQSLRKAGLLLTAGKGLPWLRPGFDALASALPSVRRHEFATLDHGGPGDRSRTNPGGKPEIVAEEVGRFFEPA